MICCRKKIEKRDFERGVADEHVDVKKCRLENGCKFLEMRDGQFQGIGRWLGIVLFLVEKVVKSFLGLLLPIFGIGGIINVLKNMRVVGKAKNTNEGIIFIVIV